MEHHADDDTWDRFYDELRALMRQFGTEDALSSADCWVDDDDLGFPQQKVYVSNLALLEPRIVQAIQQLVRLYPGWEIAVAVSAAGPDETWPEMGLTIRPHEITDGLERRYFPSKFRNFFYKGSRRGTAFD